MANYQSKLSTTLIAKQVGSASLSYGTPRSFATTSAGGANGDTVISTVLAGVSSGDDDFVGQIVQCTYATNAANIGLRRRITAYADATGTATVDRFPAQVSSGDTFELLIPAHNYLVEDTGGNNDSVIDADRDEADDYWITNTATGANYLEVIEADNVAKTSLRTVTDSASATGTLDVALGANTAIGDLFELWNSPEFLDSNMVEINREDIDRPNTTGTFDINPKVAGVRTASISKELAFRGPGNGNEGEPAECDFILSAMFDKTENSDHLTVNGAGSVSSIPYDSGTAVVGNMYLTAEGSAFVCTSAGTPCVPSPNLETAALDDTEIVALTNYAPSNDLNAHLCVKDYSGNGIVTYLWGIAPKLSISAARNDFLKLALSGDASDWLRVSSDSAGNVTRAWTNKTPTVAPLKVSNLRCVLGNTKVDIKSFSLDTGHEYALNENLYAPNESDGFTKVGHTFTGEITLYVTTSTKSAIDEFLAGVEKTLLIQSGKQAGYPGVFVIYAPSITYTGATVSDDSGQLLLTLPFQVNRSTNTDLNSLCIGIG